MSRSSSPRAASTSCCAASRWCCCSCASAAPSSLRSPLEAVQRALIARDALQRLAVQIGGVVAGRCQERPAASAWSARRSSCARAVSAGAVLTGAAGALRGPAAAVVCVQIHASGAATAASASSAQPADGRACGAVERRGRPPRGRDDRLGVAPPGGLDEQPRALLGERLVQEAIHRAAVICAASSPCSSMPSGDDQHQVGKLCVQPFGRAPRPQSRAPRSRAPATPA